MTLLMVRGGRTLASVLASLACLVGVWGCGEDPPKGDELIWEDNFEGPAGQLPDAARWRFDVGGDWGNAQLEWDTDRATNVSLDGSGNLAITARKENDNGRAYTSGRINTRDLFAQTHGRFEARIRVPTGRGIWPAFWLLGSDFAEVGWPSCGEIDILEMRGQQPNVLLGSLHGPGYSGGNAVTRSFTLANGGFDADFHVYGVQWDATSITFLLDGAPYQVVTSRDLPAGGRWVFNHPFFIILNLAVGGNFVGPPDATTRFPQTMLVDWVRVYRTAQ